MKQCNIIEDSPSVPIPNLGAEGKYILNRQTAYNKSLIDNAQTCGCFHCGSTFRGGDIKEWLPEKEGEDSALCPYCKCDAVIVGMSEYPLSTALLSLLYIAWFSDECEKAQKDVLYVPTFLNHDDYLRKGIPFRYKEFPMQDDAIVIDTILLWSNAVFDTMWNEEFDDHLEVNQDDLVKSGAGGVVNVRAYFDDHHYYVCEIKNELGQILPYTPWFGTQQDLLLEYTEQYGDSLKGVIKKGGFGDAMTLFVEK